MATSNDLIQLRLINAATEVIAAIPHHDNHHHTVSSAALTSSGKIFTGVNVYHFAGGPCAEQVTIGAAAAAGSQDLTHIVAVGNKGRGVVNPCGRCRQVLFDYFPSIEVIVKGPGGVEVVAVKKLLPFAFEKGKTAEAVG